MALFPENAKAQASVDAVEYNAHARTTGPLQADPTATQTVLKPARAELTVGERLRGSAGVWVRETGVLGSSASVMLRGADPDQTQVYLDGIPLTLSFFSAGAVDLSWLPSAFVQEISVHRGNVPFELGNNTIGGALTLSFEVQGGHDSAILFQLRQGEYGLYGGHVGLHVKRGSTLWVAGIQAMGSKGNFSYFDPGLAFRDGDESQKPRENQEGHQQSGLLFGRFHLGEWAAKTMAMINMRQGGEFGPAYASPVHAKRQESGGIVGLHVVHQKGLPMSVMLAFQWMGRQVRDPLGEIGLRGTGTFDRQSGLAVQARMGTTLNLSNVWQTKLLFSYQYEHLEQQRRTSMSNDAVLGSMRGNRHLGQGGIEWGWKSQTKGSTLWHAKLGYRHDLLGADTGVGKFTHDPNVRLGVAMEEKGTGLNGQAALWNVHVSLGSAHRAPTMLEWFGDNAFVRGNLDLQSERAWTADAGVKLDSKALTLEANLFFQLRNQHIRYRRNGQYEFIPENVDEAWIWGGELALAGQAIEVHAHNTKASFHVLTGKLSLTAMDTKDQRLNLALPLRPPFLMTAELSINHHEGAHAWRFTPSVDLQGDVFADALNLQRIAARARGHVALSWQMGGVQLIANLRDAFDAKGFDAVGYPLPGRMLEVSVGGELPY